MPHQISHDNALDSLPYELVMGVLANKTQMNGCNVSVTWFAMFYHSGEARACQQFLWLDGAIVSSAPHFCCFFKGRQEHSCP